MRCKTTLLGGATIFALAGMLSVGTASAQTTDTNSPPAQSDQSPDSQASTPKPAVHHRHHARTASNESRAERNTTKQLNEQQLAQATSAANATQVAQADQSSAQQAVTASTPDSNAAPQSATDSQPQNADNAPSSASSTVDAMSTAQPQRTAQNDTNSSAKASAGAEPLAQVQNPQQTLASAKVIGSSGNTIGTVSQIQRDSSGATSKVEVKLDQSTGAGSRTVWINADKLQYLPQDNELTTPLTTQQVINSM